MLSKKKQIIIYISAFFLAIGLAALYVFVIEPAILSQKAQNDLNTAKSQYSSIVAKNTQIAPFTEKGVSGVNTEQKGLSIDGKDTSPSAFIFTNNLSGEKNKVDVYIDFSLLRSRDFILLNQSTLKGLVENGKIDLYIHPVPSDSPISIYGPEALAESFYTTPDKSWEYLIAILKISAEYEENNSIDLPDRLSQSAESLGISGIDKASITNGTFANWIYYSSTDPNLEGESPLPKIYVNDSWVDTESIDIKTSDSLKEQLLK